MNECEFNAIAERYPFLVDKTYENEPFLVIRPDEDGWMKSFFHQMMDEVKADMERTGMTELHTLQYKSKYGQMRWYTGGINKDSKIFEIIDKYSSISENVCEMCGRPDVPITKRGWIIPICRKCYEKNKYYKLPYEEAMDMKYSRIPNTLHYRRFSKDGDIDIEVDIKNEVNAIRQRWNENHPDDKVELDE